MTTNEPGTQPSAVPGQPRLHPRHHRQQDAIYGKLVPGTPVLVYRT